ncbi:MAG: ubiquinol-cytochrome c reductase iron-sulfur subunit [Alphaproteobacteria bacterium]|nr:ubiquinol-cytochrome c reductase iron-sulfur subunit [Alphaproteobacteria bacterium]
MQESETDKAGEDSRREFLSLVTTAFGAAGVATALWPFINSMNPAQDVLAASTTDVDLDPIAAGQSITVLWRGKPVFVRHRTPAEVAAARAVPAAELRDPVSDEARATKPEWIVLVGVCTHLGCVPLGQRPGDSRGDFGGWFCPCHGSHYDTSGRIRRGPAPANLAVPHYSFRDSNVLRIG